MIFIVTATFPGESQTGLFHGFEDRYIVSAVDHKKAIAQVERLYHGAMPRIITYSPDLSQPHLLEDA